jgi:hypothetical protein
MDKNNIKLYKNSIEIKGIVKSNLLEFFRQTTDYKDYERVSNHKFLNINVIQHENNIYYNIYFTFSDIKYICYNNIPISTPHFQWSISLDKKIIETKIREITINHILNEEKNKTYSSL